MVLESNGSKGFDRLAVLHSLAVKKDRKVYEFFKKNAMNANHYMEFMKTRITSDNCDTTKTKSYVVASTLNNNSSPPFSYFVIGIDDTTDKLFCHRLPSGERRGRCTDKEVRKAMGFDTECLEKGKIIRVQGDLTMRILDQADAPEKLFEETAYRALADHIAGALERKAESDSNSQLSMITDTIDHFYMLEDDHKFLTHALERQGMIAEKEELEKRWGTDDYSAYRRRVAHELQARLMYQEELSFLKKNKQRIMQQAYDRLARQEGRYTFRQGEHKITITASVGPGRHLSIRELLAMESGRRPRNLTRADQTTFYVLRPSMVTIEHKEHGKREIMISKPSEIQFGLLNRYHEERPENERIRETEMEIERMQMNGL